MEILAVIISVLTLLAVGFIFLKLNQPAAPANSQAVELIQKQMEEIRGSINRFYSDNQNILQKVNTDLTQTLQTLDKNVNVRLDNAAKTYSIIQKQMGEASEATKKVIELGNSISSLENILKAPKLRGGMGELFLSDLLAQILPAPYYELQYRFKSREAVDAIIKLKNLLVPIDSKFPLENFRKVIESETDSARIAAKRTFIRDVKKHIDAIKSKYILPDEGTSNFALMYIPAENVYYEIIIKDENIDEEKGVFRYALDNRIFPVSPNSFYGYLQTILFGLKGMQIEEQAQDIWKKMAQLAVDFSRVTDDFEKMRTHLKNLNGSFESTDKRLLKFNDKLESLETKQAAPQLSE